MPSDSDNVTPDNPNTEQLQDERNIVDSSTTTSKILPEEAVFDMGQTAGVDTANTTEVLVEQLPAGINNSNNTNTFPGVEIPAVPDAVSNSPISVGNQEVVSPEAHPGEIFIIRLFSFAQFLMDNQEKTGITATKEVNDTEGTLNFSDPNGYVFIVTGRMTDGSIVVDDKMPLNGTSAITIIDSRRNEVTVKSSKDFSTKPA